MNFAQSKKGTQYATVWFAGPLSIENFRGRFEFIPSNLQRFGAKPGGPGGDVEADPSLPDYKRDVQFTVNGLFQPVIKSKPGQTEIWVLANVSDIAYMSVQLTETATGKHPKIAIVGQDGNPSPAVHYPVFEGGTRLVIPPATRYAIAVTMPESGDLVLEMPPMGSGARTLSSPGVLYENDGSDNPPATLGTLSVVPSAISYFDGFFIFPTQVLARAVPSGGPRHVRSVRRGTETRRLRDVRRAFQAHARLQAPAQDNGRVSERSGERGRPEGVRLCVRRNGISQRPAAAAAAQLGGGVDLHQRQQ